MERSGTRIASPSERVKKNIIRKLKEKKEELGKSPSREDVSSSLAHAAKKHFGSWNHAKEKAGLETFEFRGKKGRNWSKEKIINRLKELADELGRSPVMTDDPGLVSAAQTHFGSWNAAKEEAGLKTFSKGPPRGYGSYRHRPRESEKMEMVKLSIRISNLTDADKIKPLARELARLRRSDVDHLDDLDDWKNWAESEARSILRQYPGYYLHVQNGWAEETYNDFCNRECQEKND